MDTNRHRTQTGTGHKQIGKNGSATTVRVNYKSTSSARPELDRPEYKLTTPRTTQTYLDVECAICIHGPDQQVFKRLKESQESKQSKKI